MSSTRYLTRSAGRALGLSGLFLWGLLGATSALAAPGGGSSGVEAQFSALLEEAAGESRDAVALAKLKYLTRLAPYLAPEFVAEELRAAETPSPLVGFELWRQVSTAELNTAGDDLERAAKIRESADLQGCLSRFSLVGPFDNPSMQGFESRLGPEEGAPGPYEGKMREVDWRELPDFGRLCALQLGQAIEPTTAALAYLSSEINAARGGEARLLLGAAGAYKVWLNGEPVARRVDDRGLGQDAQSWPIELKEGENQLVIKLASTGDGDLGLIARVVDPELQPIADLEHSAARAGGALQELTADNSPAASPRSLRAQVEELSRGADGRAVWAAWLWRQLEPANAGTPWRGAALRALEAAKDAPGAVDARELALAADLVEEYWQKLELLELARARAPEDLWVARQLAGLYARSETLALQLRERELLDEILAQDPNYLPARIDLSDWYLNQGLDAAALQALLHGARRSVEGADLGENSAQNIKPSADEKQLEAWSKTPRFLSQRAYLTSSAGAREAARGYYRQLESVSALTTGYAWRRAGELLAEGKRDEALGLVRAQQKLVPWELRWQLKEAEILRAQDDLDGARVLVDQLIAQRPGHVELYRQKAALALAAGQPDQALSALERAIEERPQDQELRRYRRLLAPASARFYKPWMVEDVREIADETPESDYSYDILVNQTLVHVEPNGLSSTVYQQANRVLSEEGVDSASFQRVNFTRGDEQVEVLGVRVYKADGSVSEDWDEWESGGARKGSSTYNDSSYLNLRANNVREGDIVEFRWRLSQVANENFRGDYFGDIAYVQDTRPTALTRYVVHYPASWTLYFREPTSAHRRVDALPGDQPLEGDYQLTGFELGSIPEVHTDANQPGYTDVYDYVMVSNKQDYNEIGRWWWNLIEEQLIVDDAIAQKVEELTDGLKSEAEKVQAIHNYVVQNTRYLHVGLGIHGWKPYRTTTAFRNRYGDCKDKAALLKVMLEEAGIPAEMVLVRTRRLGAVDAEPASMHIFNHAITYVPGMDLFLDGTAEFNGTTELTSMDQGAQALIVKDGGEAEFLTLPVDKPEQNLMRREISVDLRGEQPVSRGKIVAHGQNAAYYRQTLEDRRRRDEVFEEQLADVYPGATLKSARYSDLNQLERPVEIEFEFEGGELVRESAAQSFVYAYGSPRDLLGAYARQASRTQDLSIRLPFINHTTMRYLLPPEKDFSDIPADTSVQSPFGVAEISYRLKDDELQVDIRYGISTQRISAADYPEFRRFVARMTSALNETIALGDKLQSE